MFGGQTSRDNQDIQKLALCVCQCVIECSVCFFESKSSRDDVNTYRDIFQVQNVRIRHLKDRTRGVKGGPYPWTNKLPMEAKNFLRLNQSTLRWSTLVRILGPRHEDNTESSLSKFSFKNSAGTTPCGGLVSDDNSKDLSEI